VIYKSFNEWSSTGYKIIKGSKAVWVEDKPVFSNEQVVKAVPPTYSYTQQPYYHDPTPFIPEKEQEAVYYADGSGYLPAAGPCGPLYFDRNGNT